MCAPSSNGFPVLLLSRPTFQRISESKPTELSIVINPTNSATTLSDSLYILSSPKAATETGQTSLCLSSDTPPNFCDEIDFVPSDLTQTNANK